MKKINYLLIACLFLFAACGEKKSGVVIVKESNPTEKPDPYVEWNKINVDREDEDIDFFVKRYGWQMEKTGTGLRYQLLKEGVGDNIKPEDVVTLKYTTLLLTGDTIYTSRQNGEKKFKVDKSDEIIGLNEAVKMMKKNSKANIIIPSFLGYGVAGDGAKIRGKVSLAMQIEVVDVE